jgi:uncharacterized peroxidase-related enzyme
MSTFQIHTEESAPVEARPILAGARAATGFVPNLHGVLAEAPAVLESYLHLWKTFQKMSSFSPVEQQVILLAVSVENACEYCVAGHTGLARQAGLDDASVAALREGRPLAEARLEALRRLAGSLTRHRGRVEDAEIDLFLAAGFTPRQVLEVILGIAVKTIGNSVNHVAHTPVDAVFQAHRWSPPSRTAA